MLRLGLFFLMLFVPLCWTSCELGGSTDTDNGMNSNTPNWELRSLDSGSIWDSTQLFIAGLNAEGSDVYEVDKGSGNNNDEFSLNSNLKLDGGELSDSLISFQTYAVDSGAVIVINDLSGKPLSNFGFKLIPNDFNPVLETDPNSHPMYVTDEFGVAIVDNIPLEHAANLEAVNSLSGDEVLYLLPLTFAPNKVQFHRFYLPEAGPALGRVNRASNLKFDSLAVFYRGSTQLRYSDSAGLFDFGLANIQISTLEFFITASTKWDSSPNSFINDTTNDIPSNCRIKKLEDSELERSRENMNMETKLGTWTIVDVDSDNCVPDSLKILESLIPEQEAVLDRLTKNNFCEDAPDCDFQRAEFKNGCHFARAYNGLNSDSAAISTALEKLVHLYNRRYDLEVKAEREPGICDDITTQLAETVCENSICTLK